uniref:Uncharacterized protein n=1 Tax=uncultured marine virus TaxID=186617 RepID=A0A0F7LB42_9VIRU|nr:hypothetical protein [uncultured marine virus]
MSFESGGIDTDDVSQAAVDICGRGKIQSRTSARISGDDESGAIIFSFWPPFPESL